MAAYTRNVTPNSHHNPELLPAASVVRSTPNTVHGCRPTSVAIHPASRAMIASGPAAAENRRNQRFSSRSRSRQRVHQNSTTASASRVPIPTID